MSIGRYERILTDWDKLRLDILLTPFVHGWDNTTTDSWQRVTLSNFPWNDVVPYPTNLRVQNNNEAVLKYVNENREAKNLKPFSNHSRVTTGCYDANHGRINFIDINLYFSVKDLCEASGYGWDIIEDEGEYPDLSPSGRNFFCRIGRHRFEDEPEILEYVRKEEGIMSFFDGMFGCGFQDAVQTGIKRCRRCGQRLFVKRTGAFPLGTNTSWEVCGEDEWHRVKRLPKVSI